GVADARTGRLPRGRHQAADGAGRYSAPAPHLQRRAFGRGRGASRGPRTHQRPGDGAVTAAFVTATGTDVGKTFVTAGLIRHFRTAGRAVEAFKPVVSGFDPATPALSDPGMLLAALGRKVTPEELDRIAPFRFAAPLSPDMAARREGRTLDFDAIVEF